MRRRVLGAGRGGITRKAHAMHGLMALILLAAVTYTPETDGTYTLRAQPTSINTDEVCFFDEATSVGCVVSDGVAVASLNLVLDCGVHVITATARNTFGESLVSNSGGTMGVPCAPLLIAQ